MVELGGQVIHERSKERECLCDGFKESCPQGKGNVLFHLEDRGILKGAAGDELNTKGAALCPITPIRCRREEIGDSVSVPITPLSVESPQSPKAGSLNLTSEVVVAPDLNDSPRTPVDGVFDPFAPGPDHLLFAPICKKFVKKPQRIVARRLNFDDIDVVPASGGVVDHENADILSEEAILESVYRMLLEAILLKQSEEFLADNQSLEFDDPLTPTSPPPMTIIAETCPAAPVKASVGSSRSIDPSLCRKLEF